MKTYLALDVGTQLIGVAVGSTITQSARPLQSIPAAPEDLCWRAMDKLEREWQPSAYVVGLPITINGDEQPITKRARAFAESLKVRFNKEVHLTDERSSTKQAKRLFAEKRAEGQSKRKQADAVDAWAAAIILERFLLEQPA
jgi:putative holliday junction resolvase